jgi:hypothetical protein
MAENDTSWMGDVADVGPERQVRDAEEKLVANSASFAGILV